MFAWWWQITGPTGPLGWFFSTTGRWYAVTSGLGLPLTGLIAFVRHQNCHERFCPRIGHHPDLLQPSFKRCTRHMIKSQNTQSTT